MQRTATVQTRGRVTLPVGIRQALQIAPGDDVVFVQTAPGRFELKAEGRRAALLSRPHASRPEVARTRRVRQLELPFQPASGSAEACCEPADIGARRPCA